MRETSESQRPTASPATAWGAMVAHCRLHGFVVQEHGAMSVRAGLQSTGPSEFSGIRTARPRGQLMSPGRSDCRAVRVCECYVVPMGEIVVKVLAEGGSLALVRERRPDGTEVFKARLNEAALYDLLSAPEQEHLGGPRSSHDELVSFEDGLRVLDRHQWTLFHPALVHPDFADRIWEAVVQRFDRFGPYHSVEDRFSRWAARCGRAESGSGVRPVTGDDDEDLESYRFTERQVDALVRSGFLIVHRADLRSRARVFDGDARAREIGLLKGSGPPASTKPLSPMPSAPSRQVWDDWLKDHGYSDFGDEGIIEDCVPGIVMFESRQRPTLIRVVIFEE